MTQKQLLMFVLQKRKGPPSNDQDGKKWLDVRHIKTTD